MLYSGPCTLPDPSKAVPFLPLTPHSHPGAAPWHTGSGLMWGTQWVMPSGCHLPVRARPVAVTQPGIGLLLSLPSLALALFPSS